MGVLDELQEKLSGQSAQKDLARETREGVGAQMNTTEVIVPTELPDTGGVLDKLARKLERQEAVKFFMESDEAMNGPIKMPTRDASGNLVPPPLGDKFKERFLDPSRSTEAMAAKRAAEIRAKAQGPTIGPATPEQVNAPQVDFAPTEAQRAAKYDVESESYDAGKLNVLAQFLDRIQGRMQAGSAETFGALAKAGDFFQRVTGLPKGGLFDNMAAAGAYWADYFNTKAGPVSGKQRDLPEELKIVADTTGALAWDLPQIVALGPYGLAVHGGLYGLHRGGVQGMVEGTIAGALTHGIFRGIAGLPSLWQMPAAAGIGAGTAAMESDDPRQILANGATWAILQRQPGGRIVTAKEVGEGLPWVQEIKQGIKNVKGEQAVRRLNDPNQGVSREEFVLRFPEMKAHMNDRMAEGVLQSLNPDIDLAAIREAGGAMKVVEFSLSPLQHEFNLARDMVRQRIGLPSSKVADALLYFVKKMDSKTLIQSHLGAKLAISGGDRGPDYARDVDYWRESIMRGEIEARGLQPLTTGVEYVEAKYGKEGWDEITGMDATQRQAAENVRQMMLKRGYLTGRAAAEAEGDPNPERGPIPPSILKAAYEAEVAKLMGLNPMFTAPQWLNFFQTKDAPRGVTSTGPTQDTTNLLQFYLGQGKSRGYITAQGYQMVPAPPGHPAANDRGLIQWHRLVLETKLGRLLEPEEVAHHINHKPWDNRPENLVNMNRDAHLAHHMSAEGREIDQANYEAEMAKGPEKSYRLENFDTMEMRPSTEDEPVGPYATGEMKTIYHFGNAPDVSPHGMGTARAGEEGRQFERGYRGTNMLKHGYYLKSNFYTPESSTVESHLWGGRPVGRGEVDMGQLFNAKDLNPESDLSLDQQAVRAGKRGWYEPTTGQVRLFTPTQVERLGIFRGPGKKAVRGSELEKYVKFDNPSLTSEPGDPEESYDDSPVFGKKGGTRPPSGSFGLVAPGTGETAEVVDRLRFLLFDKFHPIHQLVKMLEDSGIDVPLMQNPSIMVKLLAGTTGRADAKVFYKRFVTDANGRIVFNGKSLKDIYAPHKGDMAGFDDWLWARAEREEHRLNATRLPDEQVKLELTQQEAERIYQAGKAKYDASGKELTSYFHSLLDELADSGLMTKQDVAGLKALRPDYSPLRKDLDEIATKLDAASGTNSARQTLDRVRSPIKTRRGTEKDFSRIPPTQAAVLMTYEITSAVERNRAARAIVALRSLSPEMAKLIHPTRPKITYVRDIETGKDVMTIGRQEADTIAVSIDGKRHFFKVPDDVAQSMKMIYETGLGRWVKLMAIPARTLRTGATSAPEFAFRNPLRDWLTAFMNAKKGFNPLTDFPRGLFQLVFHEKGPDVIYKKAKMDQEAYWKWKASGGEWSMLVSLDKALGEQAVRQMHRETDTGLKAMRKYIKTPLGYLEALSEAGEKPTRLGVFERARRKGLSDVEAAVESREASTDFAVRGAETKSLSALYTFLNARAQTTIKLGKTAIENPGKFAIKGLAAAGIPSLVLYYINRQDPDYWKRDQMERDLFWFLPIDIKGRQVKIPKGEIGLIFGTTVEKVLQFLDHEGALPEVVKGGTPPPLNPKVTAFLEEIMQNISPIGNAGELLPTFARPIAEWVNNKSYYYGTPLESEADQGVAPYLRYKPGTSELMKTIGKGLGIFNKGEGVSPIKLENTLRGYTGGVGRHTLRVADTLADVAGITDKGARPSDPMNTPGMAGFVSRRAVGFESEPAKVFYEMAGRIDMTKRTLGELLKDKSRAKEVLTWIEQHPQEMSLLKVSRTRDQETGQVSDLFNDAKRRLADLRKQANMISEDKNLTGDQKRQALDFLDKKVSEVVDPLWRLINAASQTPSKK